MTGSRPRVEVFDEKGIQLHEIPRLGFVVHLVVLGFRLPLLGHRIHHALELLDTSLGTEPLLGKRLQNRHLMDRELIQIGADVVELVGVGFLGQSDAVVKGLEAFLDVFRRVLEVGHEGFLLARRGAVQAGERLHAGHTAELLVHIHGHQLGLIETVYHVVGDAVFLVDHGVACFVS